MIHSFVRLFLVAVLFVVSGCATPITSKVVDPLKNMGLLGFFDEEQAEVPPLAVSWNVIASPALIATDVTGKKKGSAARIGGRAVLETSNHKVPDRYKVTWSGLRTTKSAEPTLITFRDQSGDRALVLRFEGDRLRVITGIDDEFPRFNFSSTTPHEVTVFLNMSSRPTVEVNITQGKRPLYTSPPIAMLDADFHSLDEIDINVSSDVARYDISKFIATAAE